jgi:hypothetical protein
MIVMLIVGLMLFVPIGFLVRVPGTSPSKRFELLGNAEERNVLDIIAVVSNPQAETQLANGPRLIRWQAMGFHIATLFASGECLGITHQSRS